MHRVAPRLSVLLFVIVTGIPFQAKAHAQRAEVPATVSARDAELRILSEQVAEVRRDQLNYRIEKDLLREAYSSSFQTVQLVLTLILAAFTVLGYLGLRNISALRASFQAELEGFSKAKAAVDEHLKNIDEAQRRTATEMAKLAGENAEQDRRLRGLEMREKASKLVADGNHALALEYIIVGLQASPEDKALLAMKANCLSKVGRLTEAIVIHQQLLEASPDDHSVIVNLLEAYLLAERFDEHEALSTTRRDVIAARPPVFAWYLSTLRALMQKNNESLRSLLGKLKGLVSADVGKKMNWEFMDARVALASRKDLPGRILFLAALNVLEGKMSVDTLAEAMSKSVVAEQRREPG
jgi:tetratricopeptide (TPR) repeat protein